MGVVVRESIKTSIVTYVGMIVGALNVLWLSAKFLTPEQIGAIKFINETGFLFAMFAAFGSTAIVDKYFPYWKDDENKHNGFLFYILFYSLIGFLLFSLIFFLGRNLFIQYYNREAADIIKYYYYFLPFTFFIVYQGVAEAYIRAHMLVVYPNIIREIFLKVANALLLVLYALNLISFDLFVLLFVISFGIAALLLFLYIINIKKLYLNRPANNRKVPYNEMTRYGFYVILASVGSMLVSRIDILMLPALSGMDSAGIYTVALMICIAIEVPKKAIFQITTPILSQALKNNEIDKVNSLYKNTSINLLVGGGLLFLGIWCNIDELFDIIPNSEIFKSGKYVVFWIAIAKLIDMSTSVNSEIMYFSRYYKAFMVLTILLAVITVVLNRILIPEFGTLGAALSMALGLFIFNFLKTVYVFWRFKIQPFNSKTLIIIIVIIVTWALTLLLPSITNPLLSIIVKSSIITAVFVGLTYFFKVSDELNSIIEIVFNKIKKL